MIRSSPLKAVLFMAAYAGLQSLVWIIVRMLAERYSPELMVFYRNLFGLVVMLPLIHRRGLALFATARPGLHAVRGLVACTGAYALFYALAAAPLATVVAITYAAPVFSGVIVVAFMGEAATPSRLAALAIGFAGMLMVVQPSMAAGSAFGVGAAVLGALLTAGAFVSVKLLSRTERTDTMVATQFIFLVPVSLVVALYHWQWPSFTDFLLLASTGVGFTLAQSAMARAFASADATVVLPVDFLRLLVAAAAGVLWFGERPDLMVWLGALMILGATVIATGLGVRAQRART